MVLHGIAWYCMALLGIAKEVPSHPQMAQKVKVVVEDRCDLKKWVLLLVVGQ